MGCAALALLSVLFSVAVVHWLSEPDLRRIARRVVSVSSATANYWWLDQNRVLFATPNPLFSLSGATVFDRRTHRVSRPGPLWTAKNHEWLEAILPDGRWAVTFGDSPAGLCARFYSLDGSVPTQTHTVDLGSANEWQSYPIVAMPDHRNFAICGLFPSGDHLKIALTPIDGSATVKLVPPAGASSQSVPSQGQRRYLAAAPDAGHVVLAVHGGLAGGVGPDYFSYNVVSMTKPVQMGESHPITAPVIHGQDLQYDLSLAPDAAHIAWIVTSTEPARRFERLLGRWIGRFGRNRHVVRLFVSNLDGSRMQLVGSELQHIPYAMPYGMKWLPDGKSVSYQLGNAIWKVDVGSYLARP
jgi:hypothetical protein